MRFVMSQAESANTTNLHTVTPPAPDGGSSRRTFLRGAPAAAAGALLAGAAVNAVAVALAKAGEVDPILAAIAEHRRCLDHMFACYRTGRVLERGLPRLPAGKEHWFRTVWSETPPADCGDPPEWITAQLAIGAAEDQRKAAADALMTAQPTTIRGVTALLEYLDSPEEPDEPNSRTVGEDILDEWNGVLADLADILRNIPERFQA
jgi:hypothetical protein